MGLKLDPEGYIILDITHSFHGISRDLPENLRKLSVYEKFYHPGNLTKKPTFYSVKRMETIIHFGKNVMDQSSFYY